jgi:hypothetical protein
MTALLITYLVGLVITVSMALWVHHLEDGPIELHHIGVILLWPIALPATLCVTALGYYVEIEGDE